MGRMLLELPKQPALIGYLGRSGLIALAPDVP